MRICLSTRCFFAGLEMISNAYYPVIERLDEQKDEVQSTPKADHDK